MKRDDFTMPLAFPGELIIDNFAGGGGTSTGLERAFGRPVDIAINHDPEALAMHALNHPHTQHLCESVWEVNPIEVTRNQPVALVWLSPDCKHFSKAKGGTPVAKHIRGLAWVGMRWAALCKPRVLMLENVEEFKEWGPLIVGADGKARPCPVRKGKTFASFVHQLKGLGYTVDYRELRACDYGAPTIRKRLFLIARRDGLPIVWPEPTHAKPTDPRVLKGKLQAHRSAAECIDFNLPAQSVFDRKKDLAPNTMRRIAKGLMRHVLTSAAPFIVNTRNGERAGQQPRIRSIEEPYFTVTAQGSQGALAAPVLAPFINEHANASNQRTMPADEPLRTICAQVKGGHFSVVAPVLAPLRGTSDNQLVGHSVNAQLSTVAARGTHHAMAMGHLIMTNTTGHPGAAPDRPLCTVTTGGHHALVAAHMIGMGLVQTVKVPAATLDPEHVERALACAQLLHQYLPEQFPDTAEMVLMTHQGQLWVLVDITLRMLKPHELYRAQGFPAGYQFTEIPDPTALFLNGQQTGNPLTLQRIPLKSTSQVRMCGNSVSPPVSEALARGNFAHEARIYGVTA